MLVGPIGSAAHQLGGVEQFDGDPPSLTGRHRQRRIPGLPLTEPGFDVDPSRRVLGMAQARGDDAVTGTLRPGWSPIVSTVLGAVQWTGSPISSAWLVVAHCGQSGSGPPWPRSPTCSAPRCMNRHGWAGTGRLCSDIERGPAPRIDGGRGSRPPATWNHDPGTSRAPPSDRPALQYDASYFDLKKSGRGGA
jgi:hypothetical protein